MAIPGSRTKMKKPTIFLVLLVCTFSCFTQKNSSMIPFVNPFIGTQRMGHVFPGATVPFGSVQLSPDTESILMYNSKNQYNKDAYNYCSGYQYLDSTIVGFSHTHFSGTGHSDLGDILLMPTVGSLQLDPGTAEHPEKGYRSAFEKNTEKGEPNFYGVTLKEGNIRVELTTTARVGMHRYTFEEGGPSHIILDLCHGVYNYEGRISRLS